MMLKLRTSVSLIVAAATALAASAFVVPAAEAQEHETITSVRSFQGLRSRNHALLEEAVSTQVDSDASYGGIESLDVPKTKSQAEKDAETQARIQATDKTASETVSRSAERTSNSSRGVDQTAGDDSQAAQSGSSAADDAADVSVNGSAVVSYALQYLGTPYVYGGSTPAGWDCSGFTSYVYGHFGLQLGHSDAAQLAYAQAYGTRVSDPQPGDLMWKSGHVGIYIGGGKMVHASTPSTGTIISDASYATFQYYRIL